MKKRVLQLVFYLYIGFFLTTSVSATKGGINVGPYYEQIPQVASAIGSGGWAYVLGCPADVERMAVEYKKSPTVNLMVRAFFRGSEIKDPAKAQKMAKDWAQALRAMDTPNVIYFVPINEINNPVEGFVDKSGQFLQTEFKSLLDYLEALQKELADIRGTRVVLLSPTVDPGYLSDHAEIQREFMKQIPWSSFDGTAVSMYGEYVGTNLNTNAAPVKIGDYKALEGLGVSIPKALYIVETGVRNVSDPGVLYAENATQIVDFLSNRTSEWKSDLVKSALIFSYNPDPGGNRAPWIFNAGGVLDALKNKGSGPAIRAVGVGPSGGYEGLSGCIAPSQKPIFVENGDQNKKVPVPIRLRKLIKASEWTGVSQEHTLKAAIKALSPGGTGNVPNFTAESQILGISLPNLLPESFQVLNTPDELPEENRIGIQIDNAPAPASLKAAIIIEDKRTDGQDQQIDGTTIAQPATNVEWAKPLRSLSTVYNSILSTGKLTPSNNKIDLQKPPQILLPGAVPNGDNTGEQIDSLTTGASGEIILDESEFSFIAKLIASVIPDSAVEEDDDATLEGTSTINIISQNYISDFTDPNDKRDNKNFVNSSLPYSFRPDYTKNAQLDNAYAIGGGGSENVSIDSQATIPLVSNEAAGLKDGYDKVICSGLPYGSATYNDYCGSSPVGSIPLTVDPTMYKDPKTPNVCSLSTNTIDKLAKRLGDGQGEFAGYFYGKQPGIRAEFNLRNYWGYIQDTAVKYGLNPIEAFMFFIEESGAGGFTNSAALGCNAERGTGNLSPKGFSATNIDQQMKCYSEYIRDIPDFNTRLCVYSGEKQPDGTYNCNRVFTNNPNFPGMLRFWRDEIIRFTPGTPTSCTIPELNNYPSGVN